MGAITVGGLAGGRWLTVDPDQNEITNIYSARNNFRFKTNDYVVYKNITVICSIW